MTARTRSRRTALRALSVLLGALLAGPAAAQVPELLGGTQEEAAQPDEVAAEPTLDERRAAVATELAANRDALAAAEDGTSDAGALAEDVAALERIEFLLERAESLGERLVDLQAERADVAERRRRWEDGTAARTVDFLELEKLRERRWVLQRREPIKAEAVRAAETVLARSQGVAREAERALRQAEDRAAEGGAPAERVGRSRARRRAELALREAREELGVAQLERDVVALDLEMLREEIQLLDEQVEAYAETAPFSEEHLRTILAELAARRGELMRQRGMLDADLAQLVQLSRAARTRAESGGAGAEQAAQEAETLRRERSLRRQELGVRENELDRLDDVEELWRHRFDMATSRPQRAVRREWLADAERLLLELDSQARLDRAELAELRAQRQEALADVAEADPGDPVATAALRVRVDALDELQDVYEADLDRMARTRLIVERFADELRAETVTLDPGEALDWVGDALQGVWNYEIHEVQGQSLRVRTVVTGILLLVLGVWVSRLLSTVLFQSLLERLGMAEGAAAAIRSLAFYALALTFGLFALRVVEIPLTVFTLLGGALAIGVGFGSQNLVNNFLSGLILLIERPVRVGDLVEVGGLYGNVLNIGARSTSVRTGDNLDIIVPNSRFLEKDVVNWTLGDDTVRVHVTVGVAYGSPVREVQKLLIKATEEHGKVLRNPAPFVLFKDFGDNALLFELHFWTRIRRLMDRKRIESDMRFRVERLLREGGITIAFPQRDVHLDSLHPVQVQIVPSPGEGGEEDDA